MKAALIAAAFAVTLPVAPTFASPPHCPPGLAKKTPSCAPPGQARRWRVGDRYDGPWDPVRDWWRYNLPHPRDREDWIRLGDVMIRVDEDTLRVMELIALADLVFGN